MTAIFLLATLFVWLLACVLASRLLCNAVRAKGVARSACFWLIVLAMAPIPVADELLSLGEFNRLCREYAEPVIVDSSIGGTVLQFNGVDRAQRSVAWLDGIVSRWNYVPSGSKQVAYYYVTLQVKGGWLVQHLPATERNSPLTIEGYCQPANPKAAALKLNAVFQN